VKFSVRPSILLNRSVCSTMGVNEGMNIPPRGQLSPLGARGEVKNGPLVAQNSAIVSACGAWSFRSVSFIV
jgi:hypothetical protein